MNRICSDNRKNDTGQASPRRARRTEIQYRFESESLKRAAGGTVRKINGATFDRTVSRAGRAIGLDVRGVRRPRAHTAARPHDGAKHGRRRTVTLRTLRPGYGQVALEARRSAPQAELRPLTSPLHGRVLARYGFVRTNRRSSGSPDESSYRSHPLGGAVRREIISLPSKREAQSPCCRLGFEWTCTISFFFGQESR